VAYTEWFISQTTIGSLTLLMIPSIDKTLATLKSLDHVGAVVVSMPKDLYCDSDIHRMVHFTDKNWELEEDAETESWDSVFRDVKAQGITDITQYCMCDLWMMGGDS
jgi:hypothetical protein